MNERCLTTAQLPGVCKDNYGKVTGRIDDLPAPLAFFDRRFRFVADECAIVIHFTVQLFHDLVSFRAVAHLDEAKAFGFSSELIDDQFGAHYVAKRLAQVRKFVFGNIIRETAEEKFHAYPVGVVSKNFSGIGGYRIDSAGYQKR